MRTSGIIKYGIHRQAEQSHAYRSYVDYSGFSELDEDLERSSVDTSEISLQQQLPMSMSVSFDDSIALGDTIRSLNDTSAIRTILSTSSDNVNFVDDESPGDPIASLRDQVKLSMKLLKLASQSDDTQDSSNRARAALLHLQRTAGASYLAKSKLGDRGACDLLLGLLKRHEEDAQLVVHICRSVCCLVDTDNENRISIVKAGLCELICRIMAIHPHNAQVVSAVCSVTADLCNGKLMHMIAVRERHDLRTKSTSRTARRPATTKISIKSRVSNNSGEISEDPPNGQVAAVPKTTYRDDCVQDPEVWDNRLEMCSSGVCECLARAFSSYKSQRGEGPHRDEATLVLSGACTSIASLASNLQCAKVFGRNDVFARDLAELLLSCIHDWEMQLSILWVIINLCNDSRAGGRDSLGEAGICENLHLCLTEYVRGEEQYLKRDKYVRLVEYCLWALLNAVLGCDSNRRRCQHLLNESWRSRLLSMAWMNATGRRKLEQLVRCLAGRASRRR